MTMPTLMAKYQKQLTVNRLKKAYAEIAQAVQLSEAEYGMLDTWNYESQPGSDNNEKVYYLLENYIVKRLKTTKTCRKEEFAKCGLTGNIKELRGNNSLLGTGNAGLYTITTSGYGLLFHPGGYGEPTGGVVYTPHSHILIDIDGPTKGENRIGKDCFIISLQMYGSNAKLLIYGYGKSLEVLKNDDTYGCNNNANGYYCIGLIAQNGWEIPDDYPVKF